MSIIVYSKIFKLEKLLLGRNEDILKGISYSGEDKLVELDDKDKLILKTLSLNANMPIIDIMKTTGLSLDVVKYRLKHLSKSVISAFRLMIDFKKLGYFHYVLLVRTRTMNKQNEAKLATWCSMKKEILYFTKRIGEFDFEINLAVKDMAGLHETISEFKKEFGSTIDFYELILNSDILKLNYLPF